MPGRRTLGAIVIVVAGGLLGAVAGIGLFVVHPETMADVVGVVLAIALTLGGVKLAGTAASSRWPGYDVAEVAVEGPITRDGGGGPLPASPRSTPADAIVEQIDRADEDGHAEALLLKLNTPGGEVVPSDDIRLAVERFDGPTIAYATDRCASGGYWIASGCDELWAREASIVGSIGVIGSRINATELAEKVGLSYEGFTAGEYKDAGVPLKELSEDERSYLQGLIDEYYDHFVERVSEGRDLDPDSIRETEARIFLGGDAHELGLVDAIGTREDVEEKLADVIGADAVTVAAFEPTRPLAQRLGAGAQAVAYSFGAGVAGVFGDREFRLRT